MSMNSSSQHDHGKHLEPKVTDEEHQDDTFSERHDGPEQDITLDVVNEESSAQSGSSFGKENQITTAGAETVACDMGSMASTEAAGSQAKTSSIQNDLKNGALVNFTNIPKDARTNSKKSKELRSTIIQRGQIGGKQISGKQSSGSVRKSFGEAICLQKPQTQPHRYRKHGAQNTIVITTTNLEEDIKNNTSVQPISCTVAATQVNGERAQEAGRDNWANRRQKSLSDSQTSPMQRWVQSYSSMEKIPRLKRSKSESRKRRERKLIAAGEMEVRQANETLMSYLKQCSDMHDASLSGEIEIDQSYNECSLQTQLQREKRSHLINKFYSAGGFTSVLKELSDDIVPKEGDEIYNPFTPVISPTDDMEISADKMFVQTQYGYRTVKNTNYNKYPYTKIPPNRVRCTQLQINDTNDANDAENGLRVGSQRRSIISENSAINETNNRNFSDTYKRLDVENQRYPRNATTQLAGSIQKVWLRISNIFHGLLAGLALVHLLFILGNDSSHIVQDANHTATVADDMQITTADDSMNLQLMMNLDYDRKEIGNFINNCVTFLGIYLNTFYFIAIICLVAVLDSVDLCRWNVIYATQISFRWLIISMLYIGTIVLTIYSIVMDMHHKNKVNVHFTEKEMAVNSIMSIWSCLSITRSVAVVCGWIIIGMIPQEDLLYDYLINLLSF